MSALPKYEHYKDSGIEWADTIPSHWHVKPGRVALSLNKEKNAGNIEETVLSLSYGRLVIKPPEKMTGLVPESLEGYQIINPGDIIIRPTDLQNDWTSLRVGLAKDRGIITSAYLGLKHDEKVSSEYLYYLLHSYDLLKVYYGMGTGLRQNLSWDDFKYLPLTLPPKPEQDRIVAFLDQKTAEIDALIAKKQRQIELLDEQKAILINRAVTRGLNPNSSSVASAKGDAKLKPSGIEWIGEIPEHWEVKKMKFCGYLKGGAGFPPNEQGKTGNELLFFKVGNLGKSEDGRLMADPDSSITRKTAKRLGAHVFPPATIVYAKIGAALLLNRRRMTTDNCCLDNNMTGYVVTSTELLPEWAHRFLSLIDFGTLVNPGPVPSLAEGRQSDIPIVIPSITVQKEILQVLRSQEASIGGVVLKVKEQIKTLQTLRSTLIAHAVTGRIKV